MKKKETKKERPHYPDKRVPIDEGVVKDLEQQERLKALREAEEEIKEEKEEEKKEPKKEPESIEKQIKLLFKTKKITEGEYIAKVYKDIFKGDIPLRKFAKELERWGIHYSHTKIRNILKDQGILKSTKGKEEITFDIPAFETKEMWDFFFNVILAFKYGDDWDTVTDEELEKAGRITDVLLIKWVPWAKKWEMELGFISIFGAILLPRYKKIWKKQRSRRSSEEQDREKHT